jgi:hypothetical protein
MSCELPDPGAQKLRNCYESSVAEAVAEWTIYIGGPPPDR